MVWEPILEEHDASAAWQAIRGIARAIVESDDPRRNPQGLTVFCAYLAGALDDEWICACYEHATTELCATLATLRGAFGLHGGLAGTGWALAHVSEDGVADDALETIDHVLSRALDVERWTNDYDLISGLVGYGVYFLERGSAPGARLGLTRVLAHLDALCEVTAEGRAWFTRPDLVPPRQAMRFPDGYFNCGVAHGTPGVIALFGRAAVRPEHHARALETCRDAFRWLRAREVVSSTHSGRYPVAVSRAEPALHPARTGWCYGDPGISITSWGAAARLGLPVEHWHEVAADCATRSFEGTGVVDSSLCHGTAGLAHIYNRMYQATHDEIFRTAARAWISRTLDRCGPFGLNDQLPSVAVSDLISGPAGVALVLLAAVHPVEPAWDRLLLCDLPSSAPQ